MMQSRALKKEPEGSDAHASESSVEGPGVNLFEAGGSLLVPHAHELLAARPQGIEEILELRVTDSGRVMRPKNTDGAIHCSVQVLTVDPLSL